MPSTRPALLSLCAALLLGGCATRSADVRPTPADPASFAAWACDAMHDELDRVQQHAADVAYAVDARHGNNVIALTVAVTVFWPALLAMRSDGPEAVELAQLRGRFDALQAAAAERGCPPVPDTLTPAQAAALPVALGERLVYEERPRRGPGREIGFRLTALRRGQFEFAADVAGSTLPQNWVQDTAGNLTPADGGTGLVYWTRLLKRDMVLGDVLAGSVHGEESSGNLRGQVIALGVQTGLGRPFDAAVIELFGDVPYRNTSTRIDGVMVVDRKSGVLLRLELRSANPEFALRRTLLRIQPAG
jgi:hypothetical protein